MGNALPMATSSCGIPEAGHVKPLKTKLGVAITIKNSVALNWLGINIENNMPSDMQADVKTKTKINISLLRIFHGRWNALCITATAAHIRVTSK